MMRNPNNKKGLRSLAHNVKPPGYILTLGEDKREQQFAHLHIRGFVILGTF